MVSIANPVRVNKGNLNTVFNRNAILPDIVTLERKKYKFVIILHLIELQFTKQVTNNTEMPFTQLNAKWYKILEQFDTL